MQSDRLVDFFTQFAMPPPSSLSFTVSPDEYCQFAETVPELLWVSDSTGKMTWFNRRWLSFTGQSDVSAAIQLGRLAVIHPDDRAHVQAAFEAAFASRESQRVEYRLQTSDGGYRWILDRGVPRFAPDRTFLGYVGICVDVHQEKEFCIQLRDQEETLRQLLIASDSERMFMSCSVHDGLMQDIIGADLLLQGLLELPHEAQPGRLEMIRKALSHALMQGRRLIGELRPMILDEQGIMNGLHYLAAEIENRSDIRVEISHNLPSDIKSPLWVGNIYRIVLEALTNVEFHARVKECQIQVCQHEGMFRAEISDEGCGFDPTQVQRSSGLERMRSRAQIFGGTLEIQSQPGHGTRILLRAPLPLRGSS